jgi:predicted GNAT family acetyltransferase
MSEPTVTNVTDRQPQQYEISVDGAPAGLAAYVDTGTQRIFYHTKIDDEFGGRGLGGKLVAAALDDTRAAGKRVVPVCSFVAAYVDKHDQYRDIVDPVTPEDRAAADAQPN